MNTNAGTDKIKTGAAALRVAAYLLAVMLVFAAISILCGTGTTDVYPSQDGIVDLTGIDFNRETVRIKSDAIHIYDLAFYTPEDFASGRVTQEPVRLFGADLNLKDYGTIRILLKLPPGNVYAISAKNTSYAQRLFINGKEYPPVGVTGDSAAVVTPKATRYTAAFAPEDGTTEIVLHYSNFVHSDTGGFYPITLGASILLVEDDPDVMLANRIALELEGYTVLEANTLAKGRELVERENPDLVVLDILMPDGNGLEYCRTLRGENGVRILFLSALHTKADVIAGLRAGGDDYIPKPYLMDELLVRVETLLRRRMGVTDEPPLRVGALEIRFIPRQAYLNGNLLLLTPMEFTVLEYLARRTGQYIKADELYEKVWGMDALEDVRTVWEHVSRIRNKFGKNAPVDIVSKKDKGYRLVIIE